MLYFDHNATSPLCAVAREAWLSACERFPANPSSPHRFGARASDALDRAREKAAGWLNCSPLDIVWTSGATEANNALFYHAHFDEGEAWVSAIEHPCVLEPARRWFGARLRTIPVSRRGVVDLNWLADELKQRRPALVAVMAANNETGVLQPWREALALCREAGVRFACDAAQWIGKLPAAGLGECDFATACAHKFGGPPGTGFIKVPARFRSFLAGGGQEDGRRAGTENVPSILAMTAAWELRERQIAGGELDAREHWRNCFETQIREGAPEIEIVGGDAPRLWNTVSALMPQLDDCRQRWVVRLDKRGFAVSTGSACASGKEKPSHVLAAMGITPEAAGRMLRFSSGWETGESEWEALGEAVTSCCRTREPVLPGGLRPQ